ncbi:MAG: CinA family protein [Pontiellaceae bacterium]|nr:CinA family protein [Pontiellaceae bacterium]
MNLAEQILQHLKAAGKTVVAAESITAGHVQRMLASVSGSSAIFKGGMTAYQRSVKVNLLGVDDELARRTDCVDEEIARQMALGALRLFNADYALATCGYAERENGMPFAYYAVAQAPDRILTSSRIELSGSRIEAQKETARAVLSALLNQLR